LRYTPPTIEVIKIGPTLFVKEERRAASSSEMSPRSFKSHVIFAPTGNPQRQPSTIAAIQQAGNFNMRFVSGLSGLQIYVRKPLDAMIEEST
jgi:hypothetical protein